MKKLHGIRILVVLLCLVLTLAVFVACDGGSGNGDESTGGGTTEGETTGEQKNTDTINVADYTIFTSATADENVNAAALILFEAIQQHTGAMIGFKTDAEATPANGCEILIGSTNREESAAVLSELKGQNGYVVKKVGNKIVLNATSTAMLDDAANYLVNNFISSGSDGSFEIARDLCQVYGSTGGVTLLDAENKCQYTIVYSQNVDTETNTRTENGKTYDTHNKGLDYIYKYILDIWEGISDDMDVVVPIDTDYGPAKDENLEILLGATNRPETMTFLKTLKPYEYGYGVVGNKLVIAGWGEITTGRAIDKFLSDMDQYFVESDGVKNFIMGDGESKVYSYKTWEFGVPYFNGALSGVTDLLDDSMELYYTEANADAWKQYRTELEAAGYQLWQENEIGNNLFATYYDDNNMIHTYYIGNYNAVRVVVESMATAILPQKEDANMGEKVTDTSFTMVDLDEGVSNFGNCFIITLEDGSFILHDGGGDSSKGDRGTREREELYNVLKELNKREDGEIVIAAWVISHSHWDHFKNTYDVFKQYYRRITLERILYSEPSETLIYNSYNPGGYMNPNGYFDQIVSWTGAEKVKMHTGQTIQIRNLKIEVMLSADDIYPLAVEKFNNTSLITRFDVGEGENKQRLMIVGDTEEVGSKRLVEMYGEALKCDFVQVAHHGYGGSIELYRLCSPTVVLWPKDQKAVNAQLTGSGYYPGINQSLVNQKNVKLVIVADNGHQTILLPMTDIDEDSVIVWERLDGR